MPQIYETTINAKVSALSQYGTGVEQGVAFDGVEGWWVLSKDLREKLDGKGKWPPAVDHIMRVKLRAKPKGNKPGYYCDIIELAPADGDPQTWSYGDETSKPGDAFTTNQGSVVSQASRDASIARQVVVKAEAEVIAAMVSAGKIAPNLLEEWRAHCTELWGGETPEAKQEPAADGAADDFESDIPF